MLIKKKERIGFFYFIYPFEFAILNEEIYKIGIHEFISEKLSYNRFNSYQEGSEIIIYFKINNLYENENKVKEFLRISGIKYKGFEYFKANLKDTYEKIYEIIKNDIIETCDLDNDLINKKFRKINIYYDDYFNTKYLDFLKAKFNEYDIVNNYEYRNNHFRYLTKDYTNNLLARNKIEVNENKDIEDDDIKTEEISNKNISVQYIDDENNYIIIKENNKKMYKCIKCETIYKKKDSLIIHLKNTKLCLKKQIFNEYIKKYVNLQNAI
jgi:hypothetical protein